MEMHPSVGILTDCPLVTPFGYALGPTNPWLNTIAKETLGFRWSGLSPDLRLLRPTFSLLSTPALVTRRLHCAKNASLPILYKYNIPCLRYDTLAPGIFGASYPSFLKRGKFGQ